jgi:hypothetical protein
MIVELVSIFLISFTMVKFEPLQWLIELVPNKFIKSLLVVFFTCIKCFVFWSTLIYTRNIVLACLMYFIVFWYDKIIGPYENRINL